jgi:hypothetical protein
MPVSQRVQMNFIFKDNVRIWCLSCNVKKVGKLVRFRQKGQKQTQYAQFATIKSSIDAVKFSNTIQLSPK